jgi:3',5'-cyclic AMP phosphodiesterase CpdA
MFALAPFHLGKNGKIFSKEVDEMRKHFRRKVSAVGIILFMFITISGCAPVFWIKKYRDMPDVNGAGSLNLEDRVTIGEKNYDPEKYYQTHYSKNNRNKFEAIPVVVDDTRFVIWQDADTAVEPSSEASVSGAKLTFIHLSDVHLRDEQVRLYDKETSRLADYIIPSFEHGPLQEAFDGPAYYALIQTINATVRDNALSSRLKPKFMIHTGDAIDSGVVNELYEFLYITNDIEIPWYNAIGNHDVGTFGNIEPKMIYVNDPFVEFMTMHSKFNFINLHHSTYEHYPFVNISPKNTDVEPTTLQEPPLFSKYNGFDGLNYTSGQIAEEKFICSHCPGYYSIEVQLKDEHTGDPAIQAVVLDTGLNFGASGNINPEQLNWLKCEIEHCKTKITLIFGHHNLKSIQNGKELKEIFAVHPSVVAYFCGHTHKHDINYYAGPENAFGFWEVITGATFAYPMQGSLVRVKSEAGLGFLDIYAFEHTIQQTYVDRDQIEHESELYKHTQFAYRGAVADISVKKKEEIDHKLKDRYARLRFPYPKWN